MAKAKRNDVKTDYWLCVKALREDAVTLLDVFDHDAYEYNRQDERGKEIRDTCSQFRTRAAKLFCEGRKREKIVRQYLEHPRTWFAKIGYARTGDWRGHYCHESHYLCLFCGENIATFGHNQGVYYLAKPFIEKLDRHTIECAMDSVTRAF